MPGAAARVMMATGCWGGAEEASAGLESRLKASTHVRRMFRMRTLGIGSAGVAVAGTLYEHHASWWAWAGMAVTVGCWPVVAFLWASRSADPRRAERCNLLFDTALGGTWVALLHFSLVPSAVLTAMLFADKVAAGGGRLLLRAVGVHLSLCLLVGAMLGFPWQWHTGLIGVLACLPILFIYPMAISHEAYALARRVIHQNRQLDALSRQDGLTGLANRVQLESAARAELVRSRRTRRTAVLMLLDIDDFKTVNDAHGHLIGDSVMQRVATILRAVVRGIDTPARFGGDEFAVVLAEADLDDARDVAERIRVRMEAAQFKGHPSLHCTISIGMAQAGPDTPDVRTWMQLADAALYAAKESGRNCIRAAADPGVPDDPGAGDRGTPAARD